MAQGMERFPLAYVPNVSVPDVPVSYASKGASDQDYTLVSFEPDQMQAQPAPASLGVGDTLSSLGRNVWDAVVYHTPAAVAAAVEGDDPYATWDWKDALIGRARQRAQEVSKPGDANTKTAIPGITAQDINSLGPSAGFSAAGAAAGLGAGIPAGMVASPVAGYAAGMAASGTTAYRMATNQFVRDLHDTVNAESLKTTGKPVSPQEFQAKQAQLADTIKAYGLWEAVPEAAGNALSFGILTAPVKGAIGKLFGKNIATRFAGKLGALYGEELATETVTQMGQHNAEVEAGMSKAPKRDFTSPSDWGESLREVAAPTILQTTLMAGGFKAGQMAKDRLFGKKGEAPPDNAIPAGDIGAGPGSGIEGEFIPASPSPALTKQPGPGNTYDQTNPALPPGQPLLTGPQPMEGDVLGPESLPAGQALLDKPAIEGSATVQGGEFARPMLPAPEDGGPSDRQVSTAIGLLKHSPKASPELLQRLMRVDQTMAAMLFNHWQGQSNGQVAGSEVAEVPAQGDQGQGADIGGSGIVGGFSDDAVSFTPDTAAEVAAPGGKQGMAVGATGPDAITALDVQAHAAATSPFNNTPQPTEAQKAAGNYKVGRIKFQGMDISIENPAGSVRSGTDEDGKAWETQIQHHYGYIRGTVGKDKDHLDVFIKPGAQSARTAYVIDQINPKTGAFDEHKIVFGADSEADAQAIYHANYEQGWQGMGAITAMPIEQFKDWIKSGKTKKPVAYTEPKGVSHEKPVPNAKAPAAIDPSAPYGKVGVAPFSSQIVGLQDNNDGTATVMRGDEPFYDFENGDPVTVPTGATAGQIRQAVTDAGALSSRDKWFGVAKAETKPAETGTTPAGSGTEQAKPEAIAGKPVSDMPAEQLQKIASGESKTFGPAAVEKASAELARRDEVDSPKESKEPWQYGELEFGDKYIDETVLPDLRKQLANAHGGKFQEYPSKAAAVRGLKERIDTLENHRDAKARKYYASLDNHYGAVRAALADGKPVPPVAYESYEDLKADIGSGRIKGDGQEVARVEQPQHIEAGQAEPATAPVIAASLKESAKNTPMNIEQAREWLLSEIDKAIIDAKSAKEEGIWNRADDKVNLEGIMDVGATIGFKTFNVPGDGKFRVLNLKESLQKFKKQVAASPGFKKNATRPMSLASGNGGKTSVRDLLDDGEYVLAADYGHLTGKPLLFGAAISNNAHPVAYTDAEPVDIKGVDAQVGREWNQTGKSFMWRVIETTTGAMISSESTKEKAISKVLAKLDEHGVKKLIDIIKETPKVSQAELERQFTDWGSEEEARAQKQRDALERVDTEDRALWNSIWPLDDGKKRSPNPWNDINHMQVVILAKDAAKAGKGDEFVSLIERRRGGTNNVLALAARKALAEGSKPGKQSGGVDYKGFERTPTGNGNFTLKDGNLLVKVEAMGGGKFQASHLSAKSSPHIVGEQGAVEWAANIRETGKPKTTGYPFYSNNKLYNAEGTAELPKNWTGVAMSDSGKRFFYLGWENGERAYNPLQAKSYGEAVKEAAEKFPVTDITPPEGYRKVSESYFGGSIPKPVYAPFADGDRVRAKEGGYLGTVDGISGAGQISDGAFIKFDNGTSKLMKWAQVEADPAASLPSEATGADVEWKVNPKAKSETIAYIDGNQVGGVFHTRSPGTSDWGWKGMISRELHFTQERAMAVERDAVLKRQAEIKRTNDLLGEAAKESFSALEKELAAKAHDTEADGDVGIVVGGGKVKFVSVGDAAQAAKKAIAAGTKPVPFQIHNATGIRIGDVDRVLAQANKVGASNTAQPGADVAQPTDPQAESKIEDFGEKIGGARKDVWSGFKDQIGAIPDDEIASQPFSKVWPAPDYQAMLDSGADPWAVGFIHAARDEVPAKPRAPYKVKRWVESVKLLRGMTTKILSGEYSAETVKDKLGAANGLQKLASRVELYGLVGHSKSLEGISFAKHHYSIYRGRENVTLWAVEKEAKATAWSNWPTELATGDTKDEMLSAFKAKHSELNTEKAKSKEVTFDIYSQGGKVFVGKKIGRNIMQLAGPFKTVKEARDHRTTHQEELSATLEKRKEIPQERRDTNNPRVGEDMRGGQDVTPQMFGEAFGFRGVEFGNWVEQGKRQSDLNEAYDALMDMAAILGVPPKALSLNGQLGLAFGARGTGGIQPAKAHYESDKVVINLTKKEGAGSLGHEWWHALDNYFSRIRAKNAEFMTEALDVSLASRDSEFIANTAVRKEMVAAFGKVIRAINGTALKARASKLDSKRTKEYWTTGIEMSARAFESYLISKLQDQNASNDYLANIVDEKTWKAAEALGFELGDSYPYPTAGEVPAIREAFDNFFRTVETKETDTGVAMFNAKSGSWGKPLDAAALEATIARVIAGSPSHFSRDTVITAPLFADLPAAILAKAKKEGYDANGRKPNGEKLTGATYDGKVYLVQENISSELEAEETLLHERIHQIVHGNAKDPDGIALRQSLGRLYLRLGAKSGIEHMAKEAGIDITGPLAAFPNVAAANRTAFLAEEFLAHAEGQRAYEKLPVKIKRAAREFWGEFRDWLRSSKFVRIAEALGAKLDDFTQSDLAWTLKGIRQQEAGTGSKAIRFMTAWHGSPHDHDGFDSSKIGTGEGAQAYGWGHYFAGAREVAEFYRNKLSARRDDTGKTWPRFVTYKGNTIDTEMASGDATPEQTAIMYLASNRGSAFQALQDLKQWEGLGIPDEARYLEAAKLIESGKINPDEIKADKGRLYQVELAPEPDEYLDWDKPLSEQSEKVREALIRAGVIVDGKYGDGFGATPMFPGWSTFTGESIHRRIVNHEFEKQREVTAAARKRAEQAASKYLHSIGIRGIKYLDGSSRNRPLKEIKAEFLSELPEDADTAEVMELVGTGRFSPKNEALIKALADDDWLGFDYPAQAISAALGSSLSNYDASPALLQAVSDAKDGGTHNYVIFNDADVTITAKESRGTAQGGAASPSVKAIQDVVSRFKSEFKGAAALDIRVVGSASEIPAHYRPSPYAEGVFHDDAGLIYLVTMNLKHLNGQVNAARAWQVLMHEAVGHFGLAKMMGPRFAGILKQVQQAAKAKGEVTEDTYQPGDADYATMEVVRLRYPEASDEEVAQEVLARMAETDPGRTLLGYVRAVVRQWLRDMARAAGIALDVTTAELNDLVAQASRYMRRGDGVAQGVDVDALGVADMAVGGMASRGTVSPAPTFRVVDLFGNGSRVQHFDDKRGLFYEAQKYPSGRTGWRAGEVIDGRDYWLSDKEFGSMEEAQGAVRGLRISNTAKQKKADKYGAIPALWAGEARRVAKAIIDAGIGVERFSASTQSASKYVYLSSGLKVRIADHSLPGAYDQPDVDYRYGGDIKALVEEIRQTEEGAPTPDSGELGSRALSNQDAGAVSLRADESGQLKEPAQSGSGAGSDTMLSEKVGAGKTASGGMESRAAPTVGQPQQPRTGFLDTILRKAGGELAAKITGPAYDKLTAYLGGKVPEGIKAGMVSDYGLDESYVDRRTGMQTEQQKAARQTKTFVEGLMDLDRAQSRVAYQWLNNRGAEADRLMAQLPQESQQVLKDIKIQIAKLTIEAVRLGQLDAETASRNFLAYLHRSYAKYDLNTDDKTWKAERAKAIKILGDQYKGRGLKMDVDPDRIHSAPGWWQDEMKGKRVQVLKNDAGRFAFVAEGTAIPPNLSGYKVEGVWEIRARKAADRITLWRDFTQDERQMMGELDEAKYAVARTLFMMNRDIEVGRFHEWVADEYAKTPEEAEEEGLQMADASDSMMRAFTPGEWVTVPTSKIPGTGVFKYGALAGMVVPGPVWNDIRQISAGRFEPFGAAYASILRAWKLSKTALTPTTHVNNIMGNFVMADMHDVGARDAIAAVRLMVAAANGDKDAKAMLDRFEDSGATQGMFTTHELKKEVLEPLLQQLREEVGMADDEAAILKASAIMSLALHGQFGEAWAGAKAAAKQSMAGRVTGAVVTKAQDYYQAEDSVFRLAAFLKSVDEGKTDLEAGKLARKAFLDYHINAPWINAMRGTAMPFIAFAYRAIPMLTETAAKKPWKIAKYMLVAGGLNALAYAMLGADADEDKERAYLPEEKAGRLWGIVPKLIRMPWNRESKLRDGKTTSDPVFLDVRRWIPVGDVVDYGQDKTALPMIPQPLIPGGPLIMAAEFLVNKSAFTGKELTKETDTWVEKAAKVGGHFYKGFMPNVPIPYSGTWAGTKIDNAVKGKEDPLGRAYPVPEAIASGFGLKLERYPVDTLQRNAVLDMKGKLRELSDAQRQAARDYGRQGMTKRELDEKVTEIVGKKNATIEEYKVKERKAMGR